MVDPYRRLAAAILRRAALDAASSNGRSAEARRWLMGDPWARSLCDLLGVRRAAVIRWLVSLEPMGEHEAFGSD